MLIVSGVFGIDAAPGTRRRGFVSGEWVVDACSPVLALLLQEVQSYRPEESARTMDSVTPAFRQRAAARQAFQHGLNVNLSQREWYVVDASCPLLPMLSPSSHEY